jgi:hypothetical protein
LETFIKRGGYEIVCQIERGKRKGQWRGVSNASGVTGISRPTIYKILEEHPEKPSKVKPKYLDNLEESYGHKRFIEKYERKLSKNDLQQSTRFIREGFRKLGYNAPETWTEEDYRKLWHDKDFFNPECKGIDKYIAVVFRRMMRATNNFELLEKFNYKAPPEGKKKQNGVKNINVKKDWKKEEYKRRNINRNPRNEGKKVKTFPFFCFLFICLLGIYGILFLFFCLSILFLHSF